MFPLHCPPPALPRPSRLRHSVALPITSATGAVGAAPHRRRALAWPAVGPRGRTVVGHACCDCGPHAGTTGPCVSCASGPPPGIQPNVLFIVFLISH
jgi:hypothetical protein